MGESGKRRQGPPDLLKVEGTWFKLCVMMIHTKNPDGSPALCTLIPDDRTVDLAGGEEFMTVYVPKVMFEKKE